MNSNSRPRRPTRSPSLSAAELAARLQSDEQLYLLDVREPIEFHTFNIGGVNIPLGQLTAGAVQPGVAKTTEIIVICKVGLRSKTAQSLLNQMGYTNVKNLEGGLMAVRRINQ